MKLFFFFLILASLESSAQTLCQRIEGGISNYLEDSTSRINFKNHGGLLNGGVCWWHSRLQRSSAYLVEFEPKMSIPTSEEAIKILKKIKAMKSVVVIPGFEDFNSFTNFFSKEVQQFLEAWQREDGFLNQQWLRGISGRSELSSDDMIARMDILYAQFQNSPTPVWIMAQIKGVSSHAFLILDMKTVANGYALRLIDSNHPLDTRLLNYERGQKFLKHVKENYSFVPYFGFKKDSLNLQMVIRKYCYLTKILSDD